MRVPELEEEEEEGGGGEDGEEGPDLQPYLSHIQAANALMKQVRGREGPTFQWEGHFFEEGDGSNAAEACGEASGVSPEGFGVLVSPSAEEMMEDLQSKLKLLTVDRGNLLGSFLSHSHRWRQSDRDLCKEVVRALTDVILLLADTLQVHS